MSFTPDQIRALAQPVPRYTSYPTAPHFHPGVEAKTYAGWLSALPARASLSLYFHVPFCDTLCWFCGCHTKITRQYEPVREYLGALMAETATIGMLTPGRAEVTHIHWGGGSPTMLRPDDIRRLADATAESFNLAETCDFAVEIDPRGLDAAHMDALAAAGLTRVSIGVQDFDPQVQRAINRIQSFEETRAAVDGFRTRGVTSLNIDAIYGLPHQTRRRLEATLHDVVRLRPDRIALFGYAHVPWMKKHQSMIPEEALADVVERYHQAELAADFLVAEGYERIGIDHFALPGDALAVAAKVSLARGPGGKPLHTFPGPALRRNFQGYTVDPADALIGLGASSIGSLPQGYAQNAVATPEYMRRALAGQVTAERGVSLSDEDRLRRGVIERLMCGMEFSREALLADSAFLARSAPRHCEEGLGPTKQSSPLQGAESLDCLASLAMTGNAPVCVASIMAEARAVVEDDRLGLVEETADGFRVTEKGRPFLRTIAARFDAYLRKQAAKHSVAV